MFNNSVEFKYLSTESYPSLMIIFGAMLSIAVLMLFIMLFAFCFKKGKKKLPPADVIPEVSSYKYFFMCDCMLVNDFIRLCKCYIHIQGIEKFIRRDV